jgi:hypothetical protein
MVIADDLKRITPDLKSTFWIAHDDCLAPMNCHETPGFYRVSLKCLTVRERLRICGRLLGMNGGEDNTKKQQQ